MMSAIAATGDAGSLVSATTRDRPTCRSRAARVSTLVPVAEMATTRVSAPAGVPMTADPSSATASRPAARRRSATTCAA